MSTAQEHDGGIQEEITKLRELAEKDPSPDVRIRLADAYQRTGDIDQEILIRESIIKDDPKSWGWLDELADV
jgi:hypothetical protein